MSTTRDSTQHHGVSNGAAPPESGHSRYLGIYLNDHLAGSMIAIELAKRAAGENSGSELGAFLSTLAVEIEADRTALRGIMEQLGVREDRVKLAAAWVAEKAGRLKLNGQLRGYSPLSPLLELEMLTLGITGKLLLWRALRDIQDDLPLSPDRLARLIARAQHQLDDVERHRVAAARQALAA